MIPNITNDDKSKILKFGEKITSWQLWNFFEIKGFLYKPKKKRKWIAAFLDVRLLSQRNDEMEGLPTTYSLRV